MEEKLYNLSSLENLSGGNQEFVDKMVNLFLNMTPNLLDKLMTGVENKDYIEVRAAAHKMIPSINMMEINVIKNVVRDIERLASEKADFSEITKDVSFLEITLNTVSYTHLTLPTNREV